MSTRRRKVDALQYDSTFDDSCDDELFIGTVSVDSIQQSENWKESITINQKSVMLKLDTGAQANIISDKLFRSVSLPNSTLEKTGVKLVTYDGHRINHVGTPVLKCTFKKRNYVLTFFVVPNDTQPSLSADACTELGAIVRVRAVDKPLTKDELKHITSNLIHSLNRSFILPGKCPMHFANKFVQS
jgi:hypothetical protein